MIVARLSFRVPGFYVDDMFCVCNKWCANYASTAGIAAVDWHTMCGLFLNSDVTYFGCSLHSALVRNIAYKS